MSLSSPSRAPFMCVACVVAVDSVGVVVAIVVVGPFGCLSLLLTKSLFRESQFKQSCAAVNPVMSFVRSLLEKGLCRLPIFWLVVLVSCTLSVWLIPPGSTLKCALSSGRRGVRQSFHLASSTFCSREGWRDWRKVERKGEGEVSSPQRMRGPVFLLRTPVTQLATA